jgi:membrane peptidoglycan carboxypeptidase
MSEHRRKQPQSPGNGRAAARRGAQPPPSGGGHRGTPRSSSGDPYRSDAPRSEGYGQDGRRSDGYGSDGYGSSGPSSRGARSANRAEAPYEGRAAARRAARGGGRRRAAGPGGGGPSGPPPKRRFIDYPRWGKRGWRRWMPSWKLTSGLVIGFFGCLVGAAGLAYAMVSVPDVNKEVQTQNNVFYWDNGTRMVSTGHVNRQNVSIGEIPKAMQNAVVSAENKTFWTDHGVDPEGIARAVYNMARGGETQGGSTITQQYVKNSRLNQNQTFTRKFKELFISIKVGATVPKSQIMSGYLNTSYFGRGAYGIQAAAQTYYGVNASQLDPSQCAFLAALLRGPTYYDPAGNTAIDPIATPAQNTKNAEARWHWILGREVIDGHMSATDRDKYYKKGFPMPKGPSTDSGEAGQIGYLVNLATQYVLNPANKTGITKDDLQQGGYQIYTTFNKKKVNELESTVKKVRKQNINPKLRPKTDKYVQFGAASVVPGDGAIKAIYGGTDATEHWTDNADATGAQVGSTFKPYVLAAAMTYGKRDPKDPEKRTKVSPNSIYNGTDELEIHNYDGSVWLDKQGNPWRQENDDHESKSRVTLRYAMEQSMNSPYVQLGMDVGTDKVKEMAEAAGINSGFASDSVPSFSIGTSSPSAIRMANAYGTFAASGEENEPYSVTKVLHDGNPVFSHRHAPKQNIDANVANNVTSVLQSVVKSGTGTHAQLPGREVAGKTGTTDNNESAWFIGYTPQLSTAVTMFRRDDKPHKDKHGNIKPNPFLPMYGTGNLPTILGASFPTEVWHDYMVQAMAGMPAKDFPAAQKIGSVVYGTGASSPSPSPSASSSPSSTPSSSPTPKDTPSSTPSPTTSSKCHYGNCGDTGGSDTGGLIDGGTNGDGGDDGGTGGNTTSGGNTTTGGNTTSGGNTTTGGNTTRGTTGSTTSGTNSGTTTGNTTSGNGGIFGTG